MKEEEKKPLLEKTEEKKPLLEKTEEKKLLTENELKLIKKKAIWPLIMSLFPITYLALNSDQFQIISQVSWIKEFDIWIFLIPSILVGFLIYLNFTWSIWASRIISMLFTVAPILKFIVNEINKKDDFLIKNQFIIIKRIWSQTELYDVSLHMISSYNLKANPKIINAIITKSNNSVLEIRYQTMQYIEAALNPSTQEKLYAWFVTNLPAIAATIVVTSLVGGAVFWVKNWFFGDDGATDQAISDAASASADHANVSRESINRQDSINSHNSESFRALTERDAAISSELQMITHETNAMILSLSRLVNRLAQANQATQDEFSAIREILNRIAEALNRNGIH
jgi:hypothetical protein